MAVMLRALLIVGVWLLAPALPARAQGVPTAVVQGTMYLQNGKPNGNFGLYINRGLSVFQRAAPTVAKIGIPSGSGTNGPTSNYDISGLAKLIFSTATSGTINFANTDGSLPADFASAKFSGYVQNWSAATGKLTVQFIIALPAGLQPVSAYYLN